MKNKSMFGLLLPLPPVVVLLYSVFSGKYWKEDLIIIKKVVINKSILKTPMRVEEILLVIIKSMVYSLVCE